MEKITFTAEDGSTEEFFVMMDTVISGVTYVLASETDPEEAEYECIIMKKTGEDGEDFIYEIVDDSDEFMSVYDVFIALMEDEPA